MLLGAMILGTRMKVVDAIRARAARARPSVSTRRRRGLQKRLCALVPGLERVRLVNSGTEGL